MHQWIVFWTCRWYRPKSRDLRETANVFEGWIWPQNDLGKLKEWLRFKKKKEKKSEAQYRQACLCENIIILNTLWGRVGSGFVEKK